MIDSNAKLRSIQMPFCTYSKLDKTLRSGTDINLGEYTLSNGVHCDSEAKQCYKDRFYPRTPDKKEKMLTQQIFGKAH